MFRWFRDALSSWVRISDRIESLTLAVHDLATAAVNDESLGARVAALELELDKREAKADAVLMKAEGQLKAARAAEERARRLGESSAGDWEGGEGLPPEILQAYQDAGLRLNDGAGGEEGEVPAVSGGMAPAPRGKEAALNRKWKRG
jgi:hypothetical protein